MPAALRECLACERYFDIIESIKNNVSEKFQEQYCSKECEDAFETMLADSAKHAVDIGLAMLGSALDKGTVIHNEIDKLVAQFRMKVTPSK